VYFFLKIAISALVVAAASEIARRSTVFGALIASLPLTSMLAMIWLYRDTRDAARISAFSNDVLLLTLPSLVLFLVLPLLLKRGVAFPVALIVSAACTALAYATLTFVMQRPVES
jgi:hypothetical protein